MFPQKSTGPFSSPPTSPGAASDRSGENAAAATADRAVRKLVVVSFDGPDEAADVEAAELVKCEPFTGSRSAASSPNRGGKPRRDSLFQRSAAFTLLDRLATGYDLRHAMAAANAAAKQLAAPIDAIPVKESDDDDDDRPPGMDDVDDASSSSSSESDGASSTATSDNGSMGLLADAPDGRRIITLRRPASDGNCVRITAQREARSTFLRQTYAHAFDSIPCCKAQVPTGDGFLLNNSSPVNSSVFNEPELVSRFFNTHVKPLVACMWDGESVTVAMHGPGPAARTYGLALPLATASVPLVPPAPGSTTGSRSGSRAGNRGPMTPSAPTPSLPLDARMPSPEPGRKAAVDQPAATTQSSAVTPDSSLLRDALLTMLREGRARATTPTYAVRIWVAAVRCSANSIDPVFEDILLDTNHGPLSDTNANGAAPPPESRRTTPGPKSASSSANTPAPATPVPGVTTSKTLDGKQTADSGRSTPATAATPSAPSLRTPVQQAPRPPQSPRQASFPVLPTAPSSGDPTLVFNPNQKPTVQPEPTTGRAALVVSPVKLYAVQTKRDVDVVCRRIARQSGENHHVHVTVTLRQDCPAISIPTRIAQLRLFLFSPTAHDASALAKRGPFSRDELNHAVERLTRTEPYPLGSEPPSLDDAPILPASRRNPAARSMLDLLLTSVNHSPVTHVLAVVCSARKDVGALMPHISAASAFPVTTTMTRLVDGVEETLHEFISDTKGLRRELRSLKREVRRLKARETRRQSQISTRSRRTDNELERGMFSSLRAPKKNGDSKGPHELVLDGDSVGDAASEEEDEVASIASAEADGGMHASLRGMPGVSQVEQPSARPGSASRSRARPASFSKTRRPTELHASALQEGGKRPGSSIRFAPPVEAEAPTTHQARPPQTPRVQAVATPPALKRQASSGLVTSPKSQRGVTSAALSDAYDDDEDADPQVAHRNAEARALAQAESRRQRNVNHALAERSSARSRFQDAREQITTIKDEIERRHGNHTHAMTQREALHRRELDQYATSRLEEKLAVTAGAAEDHAVVERTFIRNEAMAAKARRTADRVKSEAFESVDTESKRLVAAQTAELNRRKFAIARDFMDIMRSTGRRPTTHLDNPVCTTLTEDVERIVSNADEHAALPLSRRDGNLDVLNANRRCLLLRSELAYLFREVARTYRGISPAIDAKWSRGDFHDAAARRSWSSAPEFSPLTAVSKSLGTTDTWLHEKMRSLDRRWAMARRSAAELQHRNQSHAPKSEVAEGGAEEAGAVLSLQGHDRHIPTPLLVTFAAPAPAASSVPTSRSDRSEHDDVLADSRSSTGSSSCRKQLAGSTATKEFAAASTSRRMSASAASRPEVARAHSARRRSSALAVSIRSGGATQDDQPRTPRVFAQSNHKNDPASFTPSEYRSRRSASKVNL